jgi:hypothetical protein
MSGASIIQDLWYGGIALALILGVLRALNS